MKLLKYIPLQLTFCIALGILMGFYLKPNPTIVIYGLFSLLVVLIGVYFLAKKFINASIYYSITTYLVFICIGSSSITFHTNLNKANHYTSFTKEQIPVKAVIRVNAILKQNNYYHTYEADVLKIDNNNVQGKVLLSIRKDSIQKTLNIDNKLYVETTFNLVNEPKNPYQFNYKNYLEKQNVYRQITISEEEYVLLNNDRSSLKGLAHQFRTTVNTTLLKNGFKGDELAIINALLLGQRQEISKEILENYSKAGAIHILAVSGLHVGIILLIITIFLKPLEWLKNGKNSKLIITILLLWSFAFIAGMSASVLRAVTMFTALSIGIAVNRKHSIYKNLIISIFFLLLVNPYFLFDVGFQLSYLAVFFIVWLQPILCGVWKPKLKLVDYFWRLFTVSVAAQIGVLPLSLYYFHQFPGLFFVANLAIIPVLGIILGLGILVIFLSLLSILPMFLAIIYHYVIAWMNQLIEWIAKQESFIFQDISFSITLMLTVYLFIILSFRWIEQKTINNLKYVLVAIVLGQGVFIYEKYKSESTNEFVVFNKTRSTILAEKTKGNLDIYFSNKIDSSSTFLKSYKTAINSNSENKINSVKNVFKIGNEQMLVIDSLGTYAIGNFNPTMVLLSQSPKINLERLINTLHPKTVIADASNYKSYVELWKNTCLNNNIKFHYTVTDGAYSVKY